MKRPILFFIAMLFAVSVFGQDEEKGEKSFFFNEFSVSVNRTNVSSLGRENRFGGGAGIYHSFVLGKRFDLVLGIEYNYTSLYADFVSHGHNNYDEDMTFHIHAASLPGSCRFSVGKKVKYFLEAGIFFEFPIIYQETGYKDIGDHSIKTSVVNIELPNVGSSFGMGVRIPMKSIEWIVRADYKVRMAVVADSDDDLRPSYYRLGLGIRKNASYKKP